MSAAAAATASAASAPAATTLQIGAHDFAAKVGGLERYHGDLLRRLRRDDPRHVGLVVGPPPADGSARSAGALDLPFGARCRAVRHAAERALRETAPQLVAAHFAPYAWAALGALRGTPLVVHFHGSWAAESAAEGARPAVVAVKRLIERRVYARAARFIVLSEASRQQLLREFGIAPARIDVIPGGVDTARFAAAVPRAVARARLGWPAHRTILLAPRRLVRRTGLDLAIEAIADLALRHPRILLLIAGTGPQHEALAAQIGARQLGRHVRLVGVLPDLALGYAAADAALLPSRSQEMFGLAAVEALCAGTPAIVTPVGGMPEIMHGFAPQLVAAAVAATALAETVERCLFLAPAAMPSAAACQRHARRFDWDAVLPRIARSYAAAMRQAAPYRMAGGSPI